MNENGNLLKTITKILKDSVNTGNSVDCMVKTLTELDELDKYGYIKAALADDPVMLQSINHANIPDWLLDEHKGELRESLEEAISYWYFDQDTSSRDVELAAIFCFAILERHCPKKDFCKTEPGSYEDLLLRKIDSSKESH